ncbi:MAG TPA: hypothetical protein VMM77_00435 [Gemmatimonadaceae bacterium]|nr:hypothetical protein [Gemmatimonadaceae bacterium]
MTRRTRLWLYGSLLFALLNAGGAVVAAALGEASHAGGHVLLLFLGLYVARRVAPRAGRDETQAAPLFDERLDRLQQSLDAIAVEVERVGEGQRFVAKLGQQAAENNDSR